MPQFYSEANTSQHEMIPRISNTHQTGTSPGRVITPYSLFVLSWETIFIRVRGSIENRSDEVARVRRPHTSNDLITTLPSVPIIRTVLFVVLNTENLSMLSFGVKKTL